MSGTSLLVYRNWVPESGVIITPAYGGFTNTVLAGYPMDNLKTRQLDDVARQDGNSFYATIDLGAARPICYVGVLGLRMRRIASGTNSTDGIDINVQFSNSSTFASGNTTIVKTYGDIAYPEKRNNIPIVVPPNADGTPLRARYVRFQATWVIPVGETFCEIARLVIGYGVVGQTTVRPGFGVGLEDAGAVTPSAGGQWTEQKGPRADVMRVNWSPVSQELAMGVNDFGNAVIDRGTFHEARHALGATSECVLIPRLTNNIWIKRTAIHGHLRSPLQIDHLEGTDDLFSVSAEVVEEF